MRLGWKVLAEQSSTTHLTANSYHRVSGECGRLVQLAGHRVRFDMDEPAECPQGFSGMLEAHYRFAQYPADFADRDVVIDPHVTVRANGNHPVGFGVLGVETWLELDSEEESGWEWFYDPSSGSDGAVEIGTPLRFHQPTGRPVSFTFGGSTGDDYVLDGFVVEMTWRTLVPAA